MRLSHLTTRPRRKRNTDPDAYARGVLTTHVPGTELTCRRCRQPWPCPDYDFLASWERDLHRDANGPQS